MCKFVDLSILPSKRSIIFFLLFFRVLFLLENWYMTNELKTFINSRYVKVALINCNNMCNNQPLAGKLSITIVYNAFEMENTLFFCFHIISVLFLYQWATCSRQNNFASCQKKISNKEFRWLVNSALLRIDTAWYNRERIKDTVSACSFNPRLRGYQREICFFF